MFVKNMSQFLDFFYDFFLLFYYALVYMALLIYVLYLIILFIISSYNKKLALLSENNIIIIFFYIMTIIIIIVIMLLSLSFIPKDVKMLLIALNDWLILLGIMAINLTMPLQIYAMALKEPVTKICIIGTLMPTVLKRIVIPVNVIRALIHVFRISMRDIPDTLLTKNIKPTTNIYFLQSQKYLNYKNNKLQIYYSIF